MQWVWGKAQKCPHSVSLSGGSVAGNLGSTLRERSLESFQGASEARAGNTAGENLRGEFVLDTAS